MFHRPKGKMMPDLHSSLQSAVFQCCAAWRGFYLLEISCWLSVLCHSAVLSYLGHPVWSWETWNVGCLTTVWLFSFPSDLRMLFQIGNSTSPGSELKPWLFQLNWTEKCSGIWELWFKNWIRNTTVLFLCPAEQDCYLSVSFSGDV